MSQLNSSLEFRAYTYMSHLQSNIKITCQGNFDHVFSICLINFKIEYLKLCQAFGFGSAVSLSMHS